MTSPRKPTSHEAAPPTHPDATPAERVSIWMDLMRSAEQLLLAGMRRRIGPGGDLAAEYRRWYQAELARRDQLRRNTSSCGEVP